MTRLTHREIKRIVELIRAQVGDNVCDASVADVAPIIGHLTLWQVSSIVNSVMAHPSMRNKDQ